MGGPTLKTGNGGNDTKELGNKPIQTRALPNVFGDNGKLKPDILGGPASELFLRALGSQGVLKVVDDTMAAQLDAASAKLLQAPTFQNAVALYDSIQSLEAELTALQSGAPNARREKLKDEQTRWTKLLTVAKSTSTTFDLSLQELEMNLQSIEESIGAISKLLADKEKVLSVTRNEIDECRFKITLVSQSISTLALDLGKIDEQISILNLPMEKPTQTDVFSAVDMDFFRNGNNPEAIDIAVNQFRMRQEAEALLQKQKTARQLSDAAAHKSEKEEERKRLSMEIADLEGIIQRVTDEMLIPLQKEISSLIQLKQTRESERTATMREIGDMQNKISESTLSIGNIENMLAGVVSKLDGLIATVSHELDDAKGRLDAIRGGIEFKLQQLAQKTIEDFVSRILRMIDPSQEVFDPPMETKI
jgi:chromosome segregation ATPase